MNKKLLSILAAFAALLGWVIWLGAAPPNPNVANFPGITVGVLSKVLTDPGTGLQYNGAPISGALTPWTSDINGGGFSLTNAASVVVGGSGPSVFNGGAEFTTATAGAIAMFGSVNKDLTNATAAAIEAALGQVYQATNTVLTSWAGIPVTTAGVQALLGEVYQATNNTLTRIGAAPNVVTFANPLPTDASLGCKFRSTLTGDFTLQNPSNGVDGQRIVWELIQDGSGNHVMSLDTKWKLGTDITAATLTTTLNKRDFLVAYYNGTADLWYIVGFVKGY